MSDVRKSSLWARIKYEFDSTRREFFYAIAKEQLRQIIKENDINSVTDIYSLFKDMLQELLEAELEASIGYAKNEKGDLKIENKRKGHSTKTVKSQYGELLMEIRCDRTGEFEPKIIPKHQRVFRVLKKKSFPFMPGG